MTETTLYFVETKTEEQPVALCRWVERFYEEGRRVQVCTSSSLAAQHLDHLLWTFAQGSFIPHRIGSSDQSAAPIEPVVITVEEAPVEGATVLVCDGQTGLEFMLSYERVVHFVLLDDPEKRQNSRSLWQKVRDRGIRANHVSYVPGRKPFPPKL